MENITFDQYKACLEVVNRYLEQSYKILDNQNNPLQERSFYQIDISVRLYNVLQANSEELFSVNTLDEWRSLKVKNLNNLSISTLMQLRNFGKQCKIELLKLCDEAGINLLP